MDFSEIAGLGDSIVNLISVDLKSLCCYLNYVYGVRLTVVIASDSGFGKRKNKRDDGRFDVLLKSCGEDEDKTIKCLCEMIDINFANAKKLVKTVPVFIKVGICKKDANRFKSVMERAGCVVEIVPTSLPNTYHSRT